MGLVTLRSLIYTIPCESWKYGLENGLNITTTTAQMRQ
jgi:hypothetical protein